MPWAAILLQLFKERELWTWLKKMNYKQILLIVITIVVLVGGAAYSRITERMESIEQDHAYLVEVLPVMQRQLTALCIKFKIDPEQNYYGPRARNGKK